MKVVFVGGGGVWWSVAGIYNAYLFECISANIPMCVSAANLNWSTSKLTPVNRQQKHLSNSTGDANAYFIHPLICLCIHNHNVFACNSMWHIDDEREITNENRHCLICISQICAHSIQIQVWHAVARIYSFNESERK